MGISVLSPTGTSTNTVFPCQLPGFWGLEWSKTWHFMIPYPLLFKLTVSSGIPGPPLRHAWFKAKFLVALPVARRGHSL